MLKEQKEKIINFFYRTAIPNEIISDNIEQHTGFDRMYLRTQWLQIKNIIFKDKFSEEDKIVISWDAQPQFIESLYQIRNSSRFLICFDDFMQLKKALFVTETYKRSVNLINIYQISQQNNHVILISKVVNLHLKNLLEIAKLSYQPLNPSFHNSIKIEALKYTQIFYNLAQEFHGLIKILKIKDSENILVNEESINQLQRIMIIFENGNFDDNEDIEWKNSLTIFILIAKKLFVKTKSNPLLRNMIERIDEELENNQILHNTYPLHVKLFENIGSNDHVKETVKAQEMIVDCAEHYERNTCYATEEPNVIQSKHHDVLSCMEPELPIIKDQDLQNVFNYDHNMDDFDIKSVLYQEVEIDGI